MSQTTLHRGALALIPLLLALALVGCATTGAGTAPPAADPVEATAAPVSGTVGTTQHDATAVEPSVDASTTAGDPTAAELDFDDIYGAGNAATGAGTGSGVAHDPWEGYNRRVHSFNNVLDQKLAKPLATAYLAVVPGPIRTGVSNFFNNLRQPVSALNALLQGKPKQAGQAFGRFALNATLGVGGLFDPATDAGLPYRTEDFGQTLGIWGWENSRYLELPLFGPRTVRDTFGIAGDAPLSPVRQINDDAARIGVQGLQLADLRVRLMAIDSLREGAADDYALMRDAWMQRRQYQIFGERESSSSNLPDYLLEEEPPTIPADSIPTGL